MARCPNALSVGVRPNVSASPTRLNLSPASRSRPPSRSLAVVCSLRSTSSPKGRHHAAAGNQCSDRLSRWRRPEVSRQFLPREVSKWQPMGHRPSFGRERCESRAAAQVSSDSAGNSVDRGQERRRTIGSAGTRASAERLSWPTRSFVWPGSCRRRHRLIAACREDNARVSPTLSATCPSSAFPACDAKPAPSAVTSTGRGPRSGRPVR